MSASITDIYEEIDKLDDVKSVRELIAKLKPILAELAYYSVTGDGAVMEMRENWHNTFTGYIREGIGRDESANESGNRRSQQSQQRTQTVDQSAIYQRPVFYQQGQQGNRRGEQLPSSLDAIMKGTHMSFKSN